MNFSGINQSTGVKPTLPKIDVKKFLKGAMFTLVGLVISLYIVIFAWGFANRIYSSWNEIKFAYDKPQLVRVMRKSYEGQVSKVEASLTNQKLNPEEKVLQDISDSLKTGTSK